jgi:hypothetical protein
MIGMSAREGYTMWIQKRQPHFSLELWASHGSWLWHLSSPSDCRGIVGAAPSADEAACDACTSLEEIEPGNRVIAMAPMLLESALFWSRVLEGFGRAAVAARG